ncbi:MAG: hypothetical protein WAK86_15735 [Pseudonocardiaceae bacterium]
MIDNSEGWQQADPRLTYDGFTAENAELRETVGGLVGGGGRVAG